MYTSLIDSRFIRQANMEGYLNSWSCLHCNSVKPSSIFLGHERLGRVSMDLWNFRSTWIVSYIFFNLTLCEFEEIYALTMSRCNSWKWEHLPPISCKLICVAKVLACSLSWPKSLIFTAKLRLKHKTRDLITRELHKNQHLHNVRESLWNITFELVGLPFFLPKTKLLPLVTVWHFR